MRFTYDTSKFRKFEICTRTREQCIKCIGPIHLTQSRAPLQRKGGYFSSYGWVFSSRGLNRIVRVSAEEFTDPWAIFHWGCWSPCETIIRQMRKLFGIYSVDDRGCDDGCRSVRSLTPFYLSLSDFGYVTARWREYNAMKKIQIDLQSTNLQRVNLYDFDF